MDIVDRLGAVALLSVCVSFLAACQSVTPVSNGPVSLSISEGQLLVAICRDVDIVKISAAMRIQGGNWEDFFDGVGELHVETGDDFTFETLSETFTASVSASPVLDKGTEFSFLISTDQKGNNLLGNLRLTDELKEGQWLRGDGTTGSEKCTS